MASLRSSLLLASLASSEYPDDRCPFCYGTKFVFGFEQYFNPRRSDGRILVRTSPTAERLKMYEAGMESEFPQDMWTLTVPTIKMRDIIVLFDQDGNEEFRYEVSDVTRNKTVLGLISSATIEEENKNIRHRFTVYLCIGLHFYLLK